ncbi:hypothetical protein GCM10023190_08790 [Enteractinococcus fodinae]|uniref:Aromatic ring-opening dioxygenase LigA n=1 Tax=Enteractinococcus fodinae TaxID=684663 RepID=A0ABU2AZ64_9MICC|nr:hypothetical protein [Enteractinococcus fodinae]MDR7346645.1 hypothetical protein [Enteractinococcus fodinae]
MTPTTHVPSLRSARRPVAGYLLASIAVGAVGLVTAIWLTVSGIMNPFDEVSEAYVDIFDTGEEVGPQTTAVELEDAKYAIVSFSQDTQAPSVAELNQQCAIIDPHGDPVATNTSTQELGASQRDRFDGELSDVDHVIYTHFEARSGTYLVTCQDYGLLSDGTANPMGDTAIKGVLIGLGSMLLAAGLFIMGVVNSSRNKKAQAQRLPPNPVAPPTTD